MVQGRRLATSLLSMVLTVVMISSIMMHLAGYRGSYGVTGLAGGPVVAALDHG